MHMLCPAASLRGLWKVGMLNFCWSSGGWLPDTESSRLPGLFCMDRRFSSPYNDQGRINQMGALLPVTQMHPKAQGPAGTYINSSFAPSCSS